MTGSETPTTPDSTPPIETAPPTGAEGAETSGTTTDTPSASIDKATFDGKMEPISKDVSKARSFVEANATKENWSDEEYRQLSDVSKQMETHLASVKALTPNPMPEQGVAMAAMEAEIVKVQNLAADLCIDVQKKTAERELQNAERNMENGAGEGPQGDTGVAGAAGAEGAVASTDKMDKAIDRIGKTFEKLMEFFGKIGDAIGKAFDKSANKGAMLNMLGDMPLVGDVLRVRAGIHSIHTQIEKKFGNGALKKTEDDGKSLEALTKAHTEAVKSNPNETFDQFIKKRIDGLAAAGRDTDITLADLVTATPKTLTAEETKLEAAGLRNSKDIWKADIKLGDFGSGEVTRVEFKLEGGAWKWHDNKDADQWYGSYRYPTSGVDAELKANRERMNKIADELNVKD